MLQDNFIAGSQLVAYFERDDAHALQSILADVLQHALGSNNAAQLEVAKGCTVAYITFTEAKVGDIDGILGGFARRGMCPVTLCYVEDPVRQSGYLKLTGTGATRLLPAFVRRQISMREGGNVF